MLGNFQHSITFNVSKFEFGHLMFSNSTFGYSTFDNSSLSNLTFGNSMFDNCVGLFCAQLQKTQQFLLLIFFTENFIPFRFEPGLPTALPLLRCSSNLCYCIFNSHCSSHWDKLGILQSIRKCKNILPSKFNIPFHLPQPFPLQHNILQQYKYESFCAPSRISRWCCCPTVRNSFFFLPMNKPEKMYKIFSLSHVNEKKMPSVETCTQS